MYGTVEQKLMHLYGGGWNVTSEFVNNSNIKVGEDIARLIDDHEKSP